MATSSSAYSSGQQARATGRPSPQAAGHGPLWGRVYASSLPCTSVPEVWAKLCLFYNPALAVQNTAASPPRGQVGHKAGQLEGGEQPQRAALSCHRVALLTPRSLACGSAHRPVSSGGRLPLCTHRPRCWAPWAVCCPHPAPQCGRACPSGFLDRWLEGVTAETF